MLWWSTMWNIVTTIRPYGFSEGAKSSIIPSLVIVELSYISSWSWQGPPEACRETTVHPRVYFSPTRTIAFPNARQVVTNPGVVGPFAPKLSIATKSLQARHAKYSESRRESRRLYRQWNSQSRRWMGSTLPIPLGPAYKVQFSSIS